MRATRLLTIAAAFATGALAFPGNIVAQDNETCLMCHADVSLFAGLEDPSRLVVTREEYLGSIHGQLGLPCVGCHQGVAVPHADSIPRVDCGTCHSAVQQVFNGSLHGYALARGNPRAPTCASCHGTHNILPSSDPRSQTHKVRMPSICAGCHGTAGLLTDQIVKLPQSFTAYAQSVHGQGTGRGIAAAASCADCHNVHALRGAADPASRINKLNVASTCGQCHPDIQLDYDHSIHGRALKAGVTDSPTCTDCHGEHLILSPRDPNAATYAAREATETCGRCHDDPLIISKYNLEAGVVGTYVDSYHGWATRRRAGRAATCDDCHTAHLVLPAADTASTVNVKHLAATCGKCHEGAGIDFATSYTHATVSLEANPVNRILRNIYLVAIAFIIGLMVLHNLIIMNFYMLQRRKAERGMEMMLRFDRFQVIQHLLLTVSFVGLAITGFALRFPSAWWVVYLGDLGMTEPVRSTAHRILACVMILTAFLHGFYIFFVRRGRKELQAMLPGPQDVVDLAQNMSYYTGLSKRKARFGRYDYSQKAEYWALIWGTIVMILTGFVLWFPEEAVKVFPSIIVTASQTIHYYEAWLATLAIIVWHFFFVIFHPEEYPMSWTWLTGRMSRTSVERHHARWYEEEVAKEEEDEEGRRRDRLPIPG